MFAKFTAAGLVAGLFAKSYNQGVVFVVYGDIRRQCVHKSLLQNVIMNSTIQAQMPFSNPPRIGINHKYWLVESIK